MALLPMDEWRAAEALAAIPFVNPFLEERVELERTALGHRYLGVGPVLMLRPGRTRDEMYPELPALRERSELLYAKLRNQLDSGRVATPKDLQVYEGLALFLIYLLFLVLPGFLWVGISVRNCTIEGWDHVSSSDTDKWIYRI